MNKKATISKTLKILNENYSEKSVVDLGNPFRVLVATVISQRTRDEITETVSRKLFRKYSIPAKIATMPLSRLRLILKPSGFYKAKAKNIKTLSKILVKDFDGKVPRNINKLVELPGVGRKTANCVLNYGYGLPAIAVDIHVFRIANRLGWVKTKTPRETEESLEKLIPKQYWVIINNVLVKFGRKICTSRKPKCYICPIESSCEYKSKTKLNKLSYQ